MATQKTHRMAYLVCAVAASFYIYDYILRVMPEAMTQELMSAFHVQAGQLGLLSSLFFWGYAPMQIPVGMLFDRFNARILLTSTFLISSLAVLGFALTDDFIFAAVMRFVMGMATAFSFIGALVVGARWFQGKHFALYTGLVQFLGCMGAIVGIAPVAIMTQQLGWRESSLWIAPLGIVMTILMWIFVRDTKTHVHSQQSARKQLYRAAFADPQTWWIALYGFFIWAPVSVFAALWGVPFLHNVYHLSTSQAGGYTSIIWATIAVGGPSVGWLSKCIGRRQIPMICCGLMGVISTGFLVLGYSFGPLGLVFDLMAFGLGASGLVLAFGLVVDIQHPNASGIVIGFTNMAVILGGVFLQPLVGFLLDYQMGHGGYLQAYRFALALVPMSFLLALLVSFLVKETRCTSRYSYVLNVNEND